MERDGISADLRKAFLALDDTKRTLAEYEAKQTHVRRFTRHHATGVASALAPVVGDVVRVLHTHASPTGGDGRAALRSKAPSMRRFGRALAYTLPPAARREVDSVVNPVVAGLPDEQRAGVGEGLFENEALGTALAQALHDAGHLVTDAAGWTSLAPSRSAA